MIVIRCLTFGGFNVCLGDRSRFRCYQSSCGSGSESYITVQFIQYFLGCLLWVWSGHHCLVWRIFIVIRLLCFVWNSPWWLVWHYSQGRIKFVTSTSLSSIHSPVLEMCPIYGHRHLRRTLESAFSSWNVNCYTQPGGEPLQHSWPTLIHHTSSHFLH